MRLFLSLLSFVLFISIAKSQPIDTANVPIWIGLMQDPDANFFETQRAFEKYWENRERSRGDGYKVFKRWEWFWGQRINEDGSFPEPDQTIKTYQTWRTANSQSQPLSRSLTGDWVEIGPRPKPVNGTGQPNGNGRLNAIAFHPNDTNTIYVGSPSGGFWKTTNGGQSWTTSTDDMPTLGVSSILIDTSNTSIIYMGTGDRDAGDAPGLGVYKSTNGGQTWSVSNTGMGNRTVGQMLMHPTNSSYLLAATSGGVYRSQNAGASWTLETAGDNFKDMKFKPGNPDVVYATETSGGANFWRSTDGGDSWTMITSGLPATAQRYAIAVTPNNPDVVYLVRSIGSAYGGVYKSTDSGNSFTTQSTTPNILSWNENPPVNGGGGQGWYDLCIAADPDDENTVCVGGVNIFKSTDGGVNWDCSAHWVGSATAASVHADHHWLEYSPYDGKLYNCNDGGLYYTADDGNSWPEISDSLGIAQIYKIGVSANTNRFTINGYQDNGTAIWDNNLFRTERGGDGMECIIDPSNDDIVYATIYFGNIARSFDNGYSFGSFAAQNVNGITESGAWVTPFIVDVNNPETMFIGYKNVWRTTDAYAANPTFTAISNSLAGSNSSNMRALRLSKVNNNRLFALRSDNKLFRTDNALAPNPTWTDLTTNLPSGWFIPDIETSPENNNTIWLIRNNVVYKSTNSGASWTNINNNLPNIGKNCLVADPYSDGGLYLGTDAGVYYIDNTLTNWVTFDDGLPASAEVTELEIFHPNGNWEGSRIRAGTYGRGLWESDLYDPGTNAPVVFMDLSIDSTDICTSDTILLYNNSAYGVDSLHWTVVPGAGVTYVNGTSDTSNIAQIVINETGSYAVTLFVENNNGSDSATFNNAISVGGGLSLPLSEDFEDNTPCSTGGCVSLCNSHDWTNAPNGLSDDIDWRTDFGGTPSGGTGPTIDFDPGTSTGNYMYIESSWCLNQIAMLESPCISLENVTAPEIKFAYHREGWAAWMNDLELEILSGGSWANLWSIAGIQGNNWQVDSINLSSYIGESVKLRFIGESGSEWQADMALDGIELTAAPAAQFTATDTTPCIDQTVTLSDLSSQNPISWSWSITPSTFTFENGTNANSENPEISFQSNGSYSISLMVTNAYGNNSITKSNYIVVENPDPQLSSVRDNHTFCPEDTAIIFAAPGYENYMFYLNNGLIQQGLNDTVSVFSPQSGDEVSVIVTDSNGCSEEESIMIDLFQSPTSVLTSSADEDELCDGDTVLFTNTGAMITWHAFYRNGLLEQEDSVNTWSSSTIEDGDSVAVHIIDTNNCKSWSDTRLMSVLPLPPTPSIQLLMDSLNCTIGAEMYKWSFNDSSTLSNSDMFAKLGDGDYKVRIFDGGCWSLWSEPFIITGFAGLDNFTLKVFPSPANATLNIELRNLPSPSIGNLSIVDMQGKTVYLEQNIGLENNQILSINIDQLATGVYNLILNTGENRVALSFIKEKR
ncbi:MAG: PKD domain-containing protein [Salibacteraceae bacterium]